MKRESKAVDGELPKQHIDLSEMDESQIAENATQSQDQQVVRFSVKM
jgi:hypothetical protein